MSHDRHTTVYVTGYGPFANIKVNPSTTVAQRVAKALQHRTDLTDVHFTELETSVTAAADYFDKLEKTLDEAVAADPSHKFLLFHVGVHGSEPNGLLRVETVGYNELDASVPDTRGVFFNHQIINAADGDTTASLKTFFARDGAPQAKLNGIVKKLNDELASRALKKPMLVDAVDESTPQVASEQSANGLGGGGVVSGTQAPMTMPEFQNPSWATSQNAGRYLCNYCLYRSLKLQEKYNNYGKSNNDNNNISNGKAVSDAKGDGDSTVTPPVVAVFIHVCDPTQGARNDGGEIVKYNPTVLTQSQQTEMLAHELVDWVTGSSG